MTNIMDEDLRYIALSNLPWNNMKECTILITGATGFIGSMAVKALSKISEMYELNIKLMIIVRNVSKAMMLFQGYNIIYIESDIKSIPQIEEQIDFIIHCAAVTKSQEIINEPVENIQTAFYGTDEILKLAKDKEVKSIVYLSSMEVYGVFNSYEGNLIEDRLGYLNLSDVRSSYPEGKRICENLCISYYNQYGVAVKIARLAQTFGAGIVEGENRVYARLVDSVLNNKDFILHTDGTSVGNYCYTADAIKGILYILLKGENGETYNVANENVSMTIRQMAEEVATNISGGKISVKTEIPEGNIFGYAPPTNWKLNTDKLRNLGWVPKYGMTEMYQRMISYLKENTSNPF
jgi:nucleoside-diphosphate-sugar epimerase